LLQSCVHVCVNVLKTVKLFLEYLAMTSADYQLGRTQVSVV